MKPYHHLVIYQQIYLIVRFLHYFFDRTLLEISAKDINILKRIYLIDMQLKLNYLELNDSASNYFVNSTSSFNFFVDFYTGINILFIWNKNQD